MPGDCTHVRSGGPVRDTQEYVTMPVDFTQ